MAGGSDVSPNALPQIRAVYADVEAITIHTVSGHEFRIYLHPPVIKVSMPTVPVEVGHAPTAPAKPCRMIFDNWTVFHQPMGNYIQKDLDATPMGFVDKLFELLGCAESWIKLVRFDHRILRPNVVEM